LVKDLVRITKKVVDRLHLEKMQKHAARPGIIQGRLEEMSMTDLLQSLEMGQKSCPLGGTQERRAGRTLFRFRAVPRRKIGKIEGDDAVYKVILWGERRV